MNGIDLALFSIAFFVALLALVKLMRGRHARLVIEFRKRFQAVKKFQSSRQHQPLDDESQQSGKAA